MRKLLYILPLLFLSCSVFQKGNTDKKETPKNKSTDYIKALNADIGAIGSFQSNLISKEFQTNAFPVIKQKVRVSVFVKNMDKSTLKQLKKVLFLDSLNTPDKYIKLKILDKVTLIGELNAPYNKSVLSYLKNVEKTFFVTSVSSVFSNKILIRLSKAEEVYLISNTNNDFVLDLYNNEESIETIHLSKGVVFEYKSTGFCWSENIKLDIIITDITNDKCSKNNYKTYSKAFKKKEEFKF